MSILDRDVSRRDFLKGTGALVVAFTLPSLALSGGAEAQTSNVGPAKVDGKQLDNWIAVGGDGTVTVYTGKEELGTGTETAQLQLVAEELDVPLDKLKLVQPDTWLTVDQGYSAGSQTMKTEFATGVRIAAAEARLALLTMASQKLGVPVSQLTVHNGVVSVAGDSSKSISYAALVGNQKFNVTITGKAPLKTYDQYRVVGTSAPRVDVPPKILAQFQYTQDVVVPGMLHGRVVRPPSLDAQLVSIDGFGGQKMPGVKVVNKANFIGVVAPTEWQAIQAAQALKVTWKTTPLPDQATIYDQLRAAPLISNKLMVNVGDAGKAIAGAAKQLQASYNWPYQMHGSMGASCGVADVQGQTATVYTSSQGVYQLRGALATLLNLPQENIHVIYVEGSGCYGLNGADASSLDAALISQLAGAPVRVQYMRHDEHGWENYGNLMTLDTKAGLDENNTIVGWIHVNRQYNRGSRPGPPTNVITGVLAGLPEGPTTQVKPAGEPPLAPVKNPGPDNSNAINSYVVPNYRVLAGVAEGRFFSGPLRSPWRIQNTFANESFIDEMAAAAGEDPLAFRLKHLADPRLIAVFEAAAGEANWQTRPSPIPNNTGRYLTGRGIAGMQYEGVGGAYAAAVAEVQVDTQTGKVRVTHVWAAQDCGLTINPDGMRAQAEGCVVQGVSRTLREEVKWTPEKITTVDWATYPVLRFPELPKFDFVNLDHPDQPVVGAGEVVITALPPAIANAIFDATGKRIRQIPITPARMRAALGS